MRRRIRCPFHEDETASLIQYGDIWWCFGSCQKAYLSSEVEAKTGEHYECEETEEERIEDLQARFQYIESLPKRAIRGFDVPADERGYYLVWPERTCYKYRLFNPGKGPKYIGPKGVKPPLFWAKRTGSRLLFICEGEFNALSLGKLYGPFDVCSPGSASMFSANNLTKYLTEFKRYSTIVVILDKDSAGDKAKVEARAFFQANRFPFVHYIQLEKDPNEILCEYGKDKLEEEIKARMQFGV